MAINNPTTLVIDFNADIKTELSTGRSTIARIISNNFQIPFSSYSVGSVDINVNTDPILLGRITTGVFTSDQVVDYTINNADTVSTKFFAYDGPVVPITVSTTSVTPVTVEYALSVSQIPVIVQTAPGAPAITGVTVDDAVATVTFTAPASNGHSPITGYTVTSQPGNLTQSGTASPITLSGLTNGTAYTFTVRATNAIGTSSASTASASATPLAPTVPDAPAIYSLVPADGQVTVAFHAPVNDGRRPVSVYSILSNDGHWAGGATSPIIVTGLTNGTPYTFTASAANVVGFSAPSAASTPVTPATVPSAPVITTATAGSRAVTIDFSIPTSDGGSPITSYVVTASPGNFTASDTVGPITVNGLTNGTAYTFTVRAVNAVGSSVASAASPSRTPVSLPPVPVISNVVAGDTVATITFTTPANTSGSPITMYTVTSSPGGDYANAVSSPFVFEELTNGVAYTFTIHSTSAVGNSAESAASTAVTPVGLPSAPPITGVVAGDGEVEVAFDEPIDNGGSAIVAYTVVSDPGNILVTDVASPITVPGLTNGTTYTFQVYATNAQGNSVYSVASAPATPQVPPTTTIAPTTTVAPTTTLPPITVPTAPLNIIAAVGANAGEADVTFDPPVSDGGDAIINYSVVSNPDNITVVGQGSPLTVTGLTAGMAYTFTAFATNTIGDSAPSAASNIVTAL